VKKNKLINIGLKLGTLDIQFINEAKFYFKKGLFDYIELYVIPDTIKTTGEKWKAAGIPIIIHAPHGSHNVNIANASFADYNIQVYEEVKQFADILCSPVIIVHSGHSGTLEEAIRQIKLINDQRICIENKPIKGLSGEVCIGNSPKDIETVLSFAGLSGFVLDFGHAVCASRTLGLDPLIFIKKFISLNPRIFHLSDGNVFSEVDAHLNLGKGNFMISDFINLLPAYSNLTLETPINKDNGLNDFKKDTDYLNSILRK